MSQIKYGHSREAVTDTFTQTTEEYNFRKKNRDCRIPSWFLMHLIFRPQNLENRSLKKMNSILPKVRKNQKLSTTKLLNRI